MKTQFVPAIVHKQMLYCVNKNILILFPDDKQNVACLSQDNQH